MYKSKIEHKTSEVLTNQENGRRRANCKMKLERRFIISEFTMEEAVTPLPHNGPAKELVLKLESGPLGTRNIAYK